MTDQLDAASQRLVRTVDALPDRSYAEPSRLPGWTRAHVVAHLALNAEGLAGAVRGVVAGEPVPMYRSVEARDDDIAELAADSPTTLRERLLGGVGDLSGVLASLPAELTGVEIERTPGARSFPAGLVAVMRLREVEIHHVDLGADYQQRDWPSRFAETLLDSLVEQRGAPATLRATDLGRTWQGGQDKPTVSGTAADLGWWITGRGSGEGLTSDGGALPRIEAW